MHQQQMLTVLKIRYREQTTRHLYYLQLRKDVLEGNVYVHEDTAMLMASYALQAETSDQSAGGPSSLYFAPEKYLPHRVSSFLKGRKEGRKEGWLDR